MRKSYLIAANLPLPLAALTALVILLLLILTLFFAKASDTAAQAREEKVVGEGINSRIQELAGTILPQVMWDDAVRNLDNRFDARWADENLGVYLTQTGGFSGIIAIDHEDRPLFAAVSGKRADPARLASFTPVFSSLAKKIRTAERLRGPLAEARRAQAVLSTPIQSAAVFAIGDKPYIVIGTLVAPDFGRSRPLRFHAPIVLAILPVDQQFLETLSRRFLLNAVHIHPGGYQADPQDARVIMRDFHGREVAKICWRPQQPGHALFWQVGPAIFIIGALLFATLFLIYRRSRNMAEGLIASERRATHMALHDSLTGLPNRVLFLDRLKHGLAQIDRHGGSVVVHCIDLDRFKEVNDSLGHLVGDELLRAVAIRLSAQCRASDTFARLSGDEFAIVQMNAGMSDAAHLAERLCLSMAEPFELEGGRVFTSCSIGIALTEDGRIDPVELFRRADLALYGAKADDRGHFSIFEPEMDIMVKTRRSLEADLREALEGGQLDLFYQPQVDGSGIMTGVEALLRWNHPVHGPISPAQFVPIAEQSSLINALGAFTLRRAFEDGARWQGLKVSINISANQIRSSHFLDELRALVEELDADTARFELEITEGVLLGDDFETLRKLRAIRAMGFSLALDDFGTGFSSLSYLRKYPIDRIKIDRSFIANVGVEIDSEEVVAAIVRLARALRLQVIAEGVETLAQWTWLRSAGCGDGQGHFFRPAVSGQEIDILWARRSDGLWAASEMMAVADGPGQAHGSAMRLGVRDRAAA